MTRVRFNSEQQEITAVGILRHMNASFKAVSKTDYILNPGQVQLLQDLHVKFLIIDNNALDQREYETDGENK